MRLRSGGPGHPRQRRRGAGRQPRPQQGTAGGVVMGMGATVAMIVVVIVHVESPRSSEDASRPWCECAGKDFGTGARKRLQRCSLRLFSHLARISDSLSFAPQVILWTSGPDGKGADVSAIRAGHLRDLKAPFLFLFPFFASHRAIVRWSFSLHRHINRKERGGRRRGEQQQEKRIAEGTHATRTCHAWDGSDDRHRPFQVRVARRAVMDQRASTATT